ncbi:hypothetical protein V5T82_16475 [Magnetovibrio sp. PR-2]|uniref:hypothetical protein n=1 Tax=Magnetovibrio sp. PR-2 TaxID=3120356 RepID=UPI002FCE63AE
MSDTCQSTGCGPQGCGSNNRPKRDTPPTLLEQVWMILPYHWPKFLQAAVLPVLVSVAFVTYGCPQGVPDRLPFDAVHVLMQVSFIAAMVRIVRGGHGLARWGLALPRFRWSNMNVMGEVLGAAVIILAPVLGLFVAFTLFYGPTIRVMDNTLLLVVSRIVPAFFMTMLLGLVIGAASFKIEANRSGE